MRSKRLSSLGLFLGRGKLHPPHGFAIVADTQLPKLVGTSLESCGRWKEHTHDAFVAPSGGLW